MATALVHGTDIPLIIILKLIGILVMIIKNLVSVCVAFAIIDIWKAYSNKKMILNK